MGSYFSKDAPPPPPNSGGSFLKIPPKVGGLGGQLRNS